MSRTEKDKMSNIMIRGLFLRNGIYHMRFTVGGIQVRQSTGTGDLAKKILMKTKTLVTEEKWFDLEQSGRIKLKDMISRYDKLYTEKKEYYQKKRDKTIFKHLYAFFGENASLKLVCKQVGNYQAWREGQVTKRQVPPKSGTIRKELTLLRRMFNVARKQWKWNVANPVSSIELPEDSPLGVRYLTQEEFTKLFVRLDNAEPWLRYMVNVAICTGLREGNLINLRKSEVNLADKTIAITSRKMKNNENFGNPLSMSAFEALKEIIESDKRDSPYVFNYNNKQLTARTVQRAFRKVIQDAEIDDFRFHDLRHCFASYLRQGHVELSLIAALLGYKDLRMTLRYAHLNMEALRQPLSILDRKLKKMSDGKRDQGES